ncbi:MAG: folylpolyglutamate synthase/dihydrofolate synthase family protein [Bacteroidota bacterium]|nr:folylpolyglutamate synthase/dihydrofolate synthase family protein [Bacteroidota bacterium]
MNYDETLNYMFRHLPMFHRVGPAAYKADMNNTIAICEKLKNPQNNFKSVHIAGTNGKGSVSHFIASILQESGYKVGLYTSPHLKDFRERIKINGEMIPKEKVVSFIENNNNFFEEIQPSFFEMTVGLAFEYFAEENVDVAVIETGLGGRLDSTNIICPEVSVITNISLDHTNLLGNTEEMIAKEKAGIIKNGIPVVIGETQMPSTEVFIEKAKEVDSPIFFAELNYKAQNVKYSINSDTQLIMDIFKGNNIFIRNLCPELKGFYQVKNIITTIQAIEILTEKNFNITKDNIIGGIENVIKNTSLKGRWQTLSTKPLTICDTGHNIGGIREVISLIKNTPYSNLHMVVGFCNDKDIEPILKLFPKVATYYFCKADIPRGLDAKELKMLARKQGLTGKSYKTVSDALESATIKAGVDDLIFVGGSTFIVAEVI